jgi:hypothetical protein
MSVPPRQAEPAGSALKQIGGHAQRTAWYGLVRQRAQVMDGASRLALGQHSGAVAAGHELRQCAGRGADLTVFSGLKAGLTDSTACGWQSPGDDEGVALL